MKLKEHISAGDCLILLIITALSCLLTALPSLGTGLQTIFSEATYTMGDGETPAFAEAMVLQKAKRQALEEAGTYVLSYSKTRNMDLTQDEILMVAGGILKVETLEQNRQLIGNGLTFFLKIKAQVTTDRLEELANRTRIGDLGKQYSELRTAYEKANTELATAQHRLSQARLPDERSKVISEIATEAANFLNLKAREAELFNRLVSGQALAKAAATPFKVLKGTIDSIMESGFEVHVGEPRVKPNFTDRDLVELEIPISLGLTRALSSALTPRFAELEMVVRPVGIVARRFGDYLSLPQEYIGKTKLSIFRGTQVFMHDEDASKYVSSRLDELHFLMEFFHETERIGFCTTNDLRVPPVVALEEFWQIGEWREKLTPENTPPCRSNNCLHDHLIALHPQLVIEFWDKLGFHLPQERVSEATKTGKFAYGSRTWAIRMERSGRPFSLLMIEDTLEGRSANVKVSSKLLENMTRVTARLVAKSDIPVKGPDLNCRIQLGTDAEFFR